MGIDDLACTVFDFLTPLVRTTKAASILASGDKGREMGTHVMESLVSLLVQYTQVSRVNVSMHRPVWKD